MKPVDEVRVLQSRVLQGNARIDAFAFARLGEQAQGSVPLVRLSRVADGLPEQPAGEAGLVKWSVRGEEGRTGLFLGQPLLHLHVRANPVLICQRCNVPFIYPVDSAVVLQLVKSEDDLEGDSAGNEQNLTSISEETSDDTLEASEEGMSLSLAQPEKVVGSHRFDLLAQVEDELILSIPYVPKHEVCPGIQARADEAPQKSGINPASPFAVLERLKHKN